MYERVQSEVFSTNTFDENSDLSTTYLGMIDMTRESTVKIEERFPISEERYTLGKFSECTE